MLGNLIKKGAGLALFSLLTSKVSSEATPTQALRKCQVGIDLGTTFTCVFIYYNDNKSFEVLTYDNPTRVTLPSTIYFGKTIDPKTSLPFYKIGYDANILNENDPSAERFIYGFKRIVGVPTIDDNKRLASFEDSIEYKIRHESIDGKSFYSIPIKVEGKEFTFTPKELSSLILGEIKSRLDKLGLDISFITISTPAYFSSIQDNEVRQAAELAKLGHVKITKEPVAACICYSKEFSKESLNKDETVLVFDIGGGTTDLSIVEVNTEEIGTNQFDTSLIVKNFAGNNFLGGENFTTKLAEHCLNFAVQNHKLDVGDLSPADKLRFKIDVEKAKIALCTNVANYYKNIPGGSLSYSFYHHFKKHDAPIKFTITEALFDELMAGYYNEIKKLLYDENEGVFKEDIIAKAQGDFSMKNLKAVTKILLVGGSSKIPWIRRYFKEQIPQATIFEDIDPDLAIAKGACIDALTSDPTSGDSSVSVLGATPLNIGIKLSNGLMQVIIPENKSIPTQETMVFTTTVDNQKKVDIEVGMGKRPLFEQNINVGVFELILAGDKPAGVPKIEVTIEVFSDYSFKVSAIEADSGRTASVVYNSELGKPSEIKVKKMIEEAEKHKAEDEQVKEKLEVVGLYETAFKRFSAQIEELEKKPNVMSQLELSEFKSAQELHKEFLETQIKTAVVAVVKQKLSDLSPLVAQLEEKLKSAATGKSVPTPEQPPVQEEKEAGRDVL